MQDAILQLSLNSYFYEPCCELESEAKGERSIMEVLEGDILEMPHFTEGLALTLGNFDGVHRGHAHLIRQLKNYGSQNGLKTALLTFSPHPAVLLKDQTYLGPLLDKKDRVEKIRDLGVDYLVIQPFNKQFAEVSHEDFLRQYLVPFFNPKYLLLGYDFQFGKKGLGDYSFAQKALAPRHVEQGDKFILSEQVVSSTLIRQFIKLGQIKMANNFLGYPYFIKGVVEKGQALGRQLGFPTANFGDVRSLLPGCGVYAGFACFAGEKHSAVLNIGTRPTVNSSDQVVCECHILDFSRDLYSKELRFEFFEKIRDEKKFASQASLVEQIDLDIKMARKVLS